MDRSFGAHSKGRLPMHPHYLIISLSPTPIEFSLNLKSLERVEIIVLFEMERWKLFFFFRFVKKNTYLLWCKKYFDIWITALVLVKTRRRSLLNFCISQLLTWKQKATDNFLFWLWTGAVEKGTFSLQILGFKRQNFTYQIYHCT